MDKATPEREESAPGTDRRAARAMRAWRKAILDPRLAQIRKQETVWSQSLDARQA